MMTASRVLSAFMLAGTLGAPCPAWQQERVKFEKITSRKEILAVMHKVNDWQRAHPFTPPADAPSDRDWVRATWYTGVMAAWKSTGDSKFLDQALAWGKQNQWQVGTEPEGGNRLFCVQTWLEAYFALKDPAMIEPSIRWLDTPAPHSPAGAKRWYLGGDPTYVDCLYGASALAMLARATGRQKCLDIMHAFFWDVTGDLFDKEEGLYYRDQRFIGQKKQNGKKILWSRGNGWAFAGIARILEYLPRDDPQRPRYIELLQTMSATLSERQGKDGLWRTNLDDPAEVPDPETSGTGFFCYGLAWGINHGTLKREQYLPVVEKAWGGLRRCVSPEGKVRWGQPEADRPFSVKPEDTHEYVTGTFLLAASEVYKLAAGEL
jgi:unsaturated rhamnogalacturonyl hydrolase